MDTTTTEKETKTDGLKDGQIHRKTNRTDSPLKIDRSIESQMKKAQKNKLTCNKHQKVHCKGTSIYCICKNKEMNCNSPCKESSWSLV